LLNCFENGAAIYRFVREDLRSGALVPLSFVQAHYPVVDMKLVKMLPPMPSGRIEMATHYSACRHATNCITAQIISESDHQRASHDPLVA
jgi:hypothetical protein